MADPGGHGACRGHESSASLSHAFIHDRYNITALTILTPSRSCLSSVPKSGPTLSPAYLWTLCFPRSMSHSQKAIKDKAGGEPQFIVEDPTCRQTSVGHLEPSSEC